MEVDRYRHSGAFGKVIAYRRPTPSPCWLSRVGHIAAQIADFLANPLQCLPRNTFQAYQTIAGGVGLHHFDQ